VRFYQALAGKQIMTRLSFFVPEKNMEHAWIYGNKLFLIVSCNNMNGRVAGKVFASGNCQVDTFIKRTLVFLL